MCLIVLFYFQAKNGYFEHLDQAETSHLTGQSRILQYCRCAGVGCGHIESGTTMVFSPPLVTSWIHCTCNHRKNPKSFSRMKLKSFCFVFLRCAPVFRFRTTLSMVSSLSSSTVVDTVDHYMYVFVLLASFLANTKMGKPLCRYPLVRSLLSILQRHPSMMHYSLCIPALSKRMSFPAPKHRLLLNLCIQTYSNTNLLKSDISSKKTNCEFSNLTFIKFRKK